MSDRALRRTGYVQPETGEEYVRCRMCGWYGCVEWDEELPPACPRCHASRAPTLGLDGYDFGALLTALKGGSSKPQPVQLDLPIEIKPTPDEEA